MLKDTISNSWQTILKNEFKKPYFLKLENSVDEEYKNGSCFPPKEFIFEALNYCSFEDLKVVIIGQDPYHGEKEANGLCFSVNDGVKIPASLRNIFTEINSDLNPIFVPTSSNLKRWAVQGVLLLNNTLTVRKDNANSHKNLGWTLFTDAIIKKIADEKENIVFLLWGNFAKLKGIQIDKTKHLVLECGHPSFASSHKKWYGNKHFSQTNNYLKTMGKNEIIW
jgi:uracil-DNA glycosylase